MLLPSWRLSPSIFSSTDSQRRTTSWLSLPLPAIALLVAHLTTAAASVGSGTNVNVKGSYWYDWGYYGAYPRTSYESFGAESPYINIVKQDLHRCDDGLVFFEPRGRYVQTPGPIIMDNDGNLVWTETRWGQAMDLKAQRYKGKDYITFWQGVDGGSGFVGGESSYIMLDEHYEVFKEVMPAGGLMGDLHEFRITDEDTILMTIYEAITADMSGFGRGDGRLFDCLFQEMDLETGEIIFQWRASDHYQITDTLQPFSFYPVDSDSGFDYFHLNSVDKNADGDYIISARHMCAVACISQVDGSIMWQLGGKNNSFVDLSDGAATNFTWNHHAAWYDNHTLTVFDNGSNGLVVSADKSRGLIIDVDLEGMTATALHQYIAPLEFLAPSQGSVQPLPNGNILVGWGHTPGFTEYTIDSEVLCDVHFGPIWFANFGWTKSYRTFKFPWVGKPNTKPTMAVRPRDDAVFVSWNGATEVGAWVMQSSDKKDEDADFTRHKDVKKVGFETKIDIPEDASEFLRILALDHNGSALGYSEIASRHDETVIKLMDAPSRKWVPEPFTIFMWSVSAFLVLLAVAFRFRGLLQRTATRTAARIVTNVRWAMGRGATGLKAKHKYEPVPSA